MGTVETIRVGIVGAGYMGGLHARNLGQLPGVRVVGVYSEPRAGAEVLASPTGAAPHAQVYDRLDALIADVDAVVVALPPGAHQGQVERIVGRGRHVFVEKPIALTTTAAEQMAYAAEAAGVVHHVGFHFRFMSPVMRLADHLREGEAGAPALFQALYRCRSCHAPWWRDVRQSGGQLLEQAIHLVDLGLHLFGPVTAVGARTANRLHQNVPGYTVEDVSALWLEFANGALGTLAATNTAIPTRWEGTASATLDQGVWSLEADGAGSWTATGGQDAEEWFARGATPVEEDWPVDHDPYVAEVTHWVECIRLGVPSRVPLSEGAYAVAVCAAAYRSAAQGGAPQTLPLPPVS